MLSINFHDTFMPERSLMALFLEYAAAEKSGTLKEISEVTGIPMGEYSGKMPAILNYAMGMGLVTLSTHPKSATKKPKLTSFGHIVIKEDPYMGEALTQWIAHMNLCRNDIGARTWHELFARGKFALGTTFTRGQLEDYLVSVFGKGSKNRTGPLIVTYADEAAMAKSGILTVEEEKIVRNKAPLLDYYAIAYSAHILTLMEDYFPQQGQVTLRDFNQKTNWFDICLWSEADIEKILEVIEGKQFVTVDRQMKPWILEKRTASEKVWPHIYDELP